MSLAWFAIRRRPHNYLLVACYVTRGGQRRLVIGAHVQRADAVTAAGAL